MKLQKANTPVLLKRFYKLTREIYKENQNYRHTEEEVAKLIIEGPTHFHTHADVYPFLIIEKTQIIGRVVLIRDIKNPLLVQAGFFEIKKRFSNPVELIRKKAKELFRDAKTIIFGLGGHINYSAGILLNHFDRPPIFGLPYSPPYYKEIFRGLKQHTLWSFRFPTEPFFNHKEQISKGLNLDGITVRPMDKKNLKRDTAIYTELNNRCFADHPLWSDREEQEDFELFDPFRFLIKNENLLIAEKAGKPIGFFLWYPDFNQLINHKQALGLQHVLKYHLFNPIDTFRFTQIGILPEMRISKCVLALIMAATPYVQKSGYTFGEGGFIFEDNINSMNMAYRYIQRVTGEKMEPFRKYGIFEGTLE